MPTCCPVAYGEPAYATEIGCAGAVGGMGGAAYAPFTMYCAAASVGACRNYVCAYAHLPSPAAVAAAAAVAGMSIECNSIGSVPI